MPKWNVDDTRPVEPTPGADCDTSYLVKLSRGERRARPATRGGTPALEVRELEVDMPGEQVRAVSFTLQRGEILLNRVRCRHPDQ